MVTPEQKKEIEFMKEHSRDIIAPKDANEILSKFCEISAVPFIKAEEAYKYRAEMTQEQKELVFLKNN